MRVSSTLLCRYELGILPGESPMRSGLISFIALGMMALTPLLLAEETPLSESTDGDEGLVIGARDPKVFNEIDRFILTRLRAESIEPSAICSDYEFARRVYVDVLGVIPTPEEIRAFAGDKSEDKRAKLIDKLLRDNERYADHWEVMWGDWLREHSVAKKKEGTAQGSYREWLRQALKSNMPYDQFARKLLTASGSPSDNGAVNFFIRDQQNRVETVNTMAQAFMGTRMACAQCHDHPFDKWTQTDFHGLMAYFGQTAVSKPPKKGKEYEESRARQLEGRVPHARRRRQRGEEGQQGRRNREAGVCGESVDHDVGVGDAARAVGERGHRKSAVRAGSSESAVGAINGTRDCRAAGRFPREESAVASG